MRTNRRVATNPDERKPVSVSLDEESVRKIRGKQKRKKQALPGLQRQRIGVRNPTMENGIFFRSKVSLERAVGSVHCLNIKQWKEGVKKEQVKGCGSVNRPTPGSQRPAEPVATGFSQGVKISKNRGRF